MKAGHPSWTTIQVLGLIVFGPSWFAVALTLFLAEIPVAYYRERDLRLAVLSAGTLIGIILVHAKTCWRLEETFWGGQIFDLPYALMTYSIFACIGMMPFRLHRVARLRSKRATPCSDA